MWPAIVSALAESLPARKPPGIDERAMRAPQETPADIVRWIAGQPEDVVLVLDDLHEVTDRDVHAQLVELIVTASARFQLIVVTRRSPPWPLSRLRAAGLVDELSEEEIGFDRDEAKELFGQLGIDLTAPDLGVVLEKTKGWAAGLRLAAMAAGSRTDAASFLRSMSSETGYIGDYLTHEVYDGLGPELRELLIAGGAVNEVCADLADALLEVTGSGERLADLARQNAFVYEISARPGWYRLHPLLRDYVRRRVPDDRAWRLLQRRAASWFRGRGEPLTAFRHSIEAQEWSLAADLVGTHFVTWTMRRPPDTLRRILEALPSEAVLSQPGLAIGLYAARGMSGEVVDDAALTVTRDKLQVVHGRRRRRYDLVLQMVAAGNRRWIGDIEGARARFRQIRSDPAWLGALGLPDWYSLRVLVLSNWGTSELWLGEHERAMTILCEATASTSGEEFVLPEVNVRAQLAYLHWLNGDLVAAEEAGRSVADDLGRIGMSAAVQATSAYIALLGVALDRDELDVAQGWLTFARETTSEPFTRAVVEILRARVLLADADLHSARMVIDAVMSASDMESLPVALENEIATMSSRIAREIDGQLPGPNEIASGVLITGGAAGSRRSRLNEKLEQLAALNESDAEAMDVLEQALDLAAADELRSPLLAVPGIATMLNARLALGSRHPDFIVDLISRVRRTADSRPHASARAFAPLTERETNLLRYLASSLTIAEIAEHLFVSVNTVRTHQRAIYRKLGVKRRRDAVLSAEQWGLL